MNLSIKVLLLIPIIFLSSCIEQDFSHLKCGNADGYRQVVKNNILNKESINHDYEVCLKSNTNRDVNKNQTDKLAKVCLDNAFSLNGGVNTTSNPEFYGNIEASLRKCGEI